MKVLLPLEELVERHCVYHYGVIMVLYLASEHFVGVEGNVYVLSISFSI